MKISLLHHTLYTIRVHSATSGTLDLISHTSLLLLEEKLPTHDPSLFIVAIVISIHANSIYLEGDTDANRIFCANDVSNYRLCSKEYFYISSKIVLKSIPYKILFFTTIVHD